MIFISEKPDALQYLTINDAKYYESNSATSGDAKGDPTRDPETFTHSSKGKEKCTDTSNRNVENNYRLT